MSAHFSGIQQEVHNYMTQEIPESLKSCNSAQALKTRNRTFQLSSTSQNQSSGGVILFNIPPANYSITRGSMYLRMRVTVTGTELTGADAAHSVGFSGAGGLSANFVPVYGSGYSVFQRMTLYGASSAVLEQKNYANDELALLLMHNSNGYYMGTDAQVLMGAGAKWQYSGGGNTSCQIDVSIPLPFACFNSTTMDFPAYLLSAPLTIQLDLASVARALFRGATATITDYAISNSFLVYQAVELPQAHIEAERMAVKTHPFIMPIVNTLAVQVPGSILTSYTLGLNASSVRAAFVMPSSVANYSVTAQLNYLRDAVDYVAAPGVNSGSGVNAILFTDGNQVNSNILDNASVTFASLKQALHHNIQGSVLYPSGCTYAQWIANVYAIGWDCTSFSDEGTLFGGTPVTNVNIQLTGYSAGLAGGAAAGTNLNTLLVMYDALIAFQGDGTIEIKR